ncbi:DUF4097 and DUF4098 domain-containing protein YvlB [Fontibacillus panacisegetis]|uniref:DUF4097 and DUF4098 domain-containing protein YvlB n=1 Tax=Fontibacillus panacisegetis TaxID=670482 RepID=A0A1G7UKG4_9BACL|nr:DUF4097 family beta strand repeat-containing protein [Fontibacillus panacisegetis]SDG48024.1 DUF4097 and DUF4098 domain-containing protein YvlB [Fontibacillus panacisegetis]
MTPSVGPQTGPERQISTAGKVIKSKRRGRKHKFIACLLSAIFPGLGHLYLKQFIKGVIFIYFLLIDASALIYFSSVRSGINVPFLIILGLMIPAGYFYSLYDVLQSTDAVNAKIKPQQASKDHELSNTDSKNIESGKWKVIVPGLFLVLGGALIFLLREKPPWLEGIIHWSAGYVVGAALILTGIIFAWREGRRRFVRTGRFTASVLLMFVGILLLSDLISGRDDMLLLLEWWPLILMLGGLEYIVVQLWKRKKRQRKQRLRVDLKGLLLSIFIGASVFVVAEQDHYLHLWNRVSLDFTAAGSEFSNEEGYNIDMTPLRIPIELDTDQVIINSVNGSIDVKRAEVEDVIVRANVWVDQIAEEEAAQVAEDTTIAVSEGKSLTLSLKDYTYGESGKRHPRVNLTVILPSNRFLDMDISTTSGDITLTDVQALKQVKLQTGNGNLKLWNVIGDVSAKTLNGGAELYRIFGTASVDTHGGNLKAKGISGDVSLSTLVGDISLVNAQGSINANTKNGNIKVDGAPEQLQVESLNGKIMVTSEMIGGDWNVYSAVGEMHLEIPSFGNYMLEVNSGYGDISTNLPFFVNKKEIKGVMGTGQYQLKVEGNSNVIVNNSR